MKERSCFEMTDINLIQKIKPFFYRTDPSEALTLPLTYCSCKYGYIPVQLFYLTHMHLTNDGIERDVLKQSHKVYLKCKEREKEERECCSALME